MKRIKIGLNGFGRIGRAVTRIAADKEFFSLEAINTSSTTPESLAYTLKYDSVYRTFNKNVEAHNDGISIDGKFIKAYNTRDPREIPWQNHEIDVVIDCTGVFEDREGLSKHLHDSVRKVILTAPTKDDSIPHVVLGANDHRFDFSQADIISNASCTTNCASIMARVLNEEFGIESGHLSTTHAYTSTQALVDNKADSPTRGRAAALSIIPTTTGASTALCSVTDIPKSHFAGMSLRVPTPVGSITDMVCLLNRETSAEEINAVFQRRSNEDLRGILGYETQQLVSSDYIGSPFSCVFDANYTSVLNGRHVKIFGWYDNEWGYSNRVVDLAEKLSDFV